MLDPVCEAQAASLSISPGPAPFRLGIEGEAGRDYVLESSANPGRPDSWEFFLSLTLNGKSHNWLDSSSQLQPHRFYRLVPLTAPAPVRLAEDFRLIDAAGKSRGLSYDSTKRAVVLVFTDQTAASSPQILSTFKTLRDQFNSQGVLFWMIDADPQSVAASAADQSTDAPTEWPVLQDRAQLVARAYGAAAVGEAVCIDTATWSVFYRGAIDDRADTTASTANQNYLADALTGFLSGTSPVITGTRPNGGALRLAPRPAVSYSKDIAPLLQKNCVSCHSRGNIAPWAMTDHAVVQSYAQSIKSQVLTGRMPPWHADPAHGTFSNDISLKPAEARNLLQWFADGAPRGDGSDPLADVAVHSPPPTNYPFAWPPELGQPDHIVKIPTQSIAATGEIPYKYPQVTVNVPSNVWLRAAVVRPGNTRAVHHALVFSGSFLEVFLQGGGLGGYFAGYVPGIKASSFPEGTGKFLAKNSTVTFQMHYTTTGQTETDQTQLGLYFMRPPPALELTTGAAATLNIAIPAGASEYEREAQVIPSATKDVWLYELSPHMHYRGARFKFEALYPDGATEVLLSVPKYDFHWQTLYRLAQPKRLPAGTIVRCRGAFDNSALNLDNPNPAVTVKFGEQTDDEMFIGYLNYAVIP